MNPQPHPCPARHRLAAAALWLLLSLPAVALAGPGAHGPNGEHLDGPSTAPAASTKPRVEAQSEGFELLAELHAAELVILVDRYASNEPVLGARLEVESGGLKAGAAFRAEQGDYVVSDAALLKALAAPGEHGLVFVLVAGAESDLLEGTLVTGGGRAGTAATPGGHGPGRDGDDPAHDHPPGRAAWIGAGVAVLGLLGAVAWRRRRRRGTATLKGAL